MLLLQLITLIMSEMFSGSHWVLQYLLQTSGWRIQTARSQYYDGGGGWGGLNLPGLW